MISGYSREKVRPTVLTTIRPVIVKKIDGKTKPIGAAPSIMPPCIIRFIISTMVEPEKGVWNIELSQTLIATRAMIEVTRRPEKTRILLRV